MDEKLRPVDQSLIDLLQRFRIVLGQFDAFPQLGGHVCALDGFHVKVEGAGFGVRADGSIAGVGEGAGLAVTEAGNIVLVAAEVLLLGGSGGGLVRWGAENERVDVLKLEGAELLVDHLPDNLI